MRCLYHAGMDSVASRTRSAGPILGYYLEWRTEASAGGHYAIGHVHGSSPSTEPAVAELRVGPYRDARFAYLMLASAVRLKIENRSGACSSLPLAPALSC